MTTGERMKILIDFFESQKGKTKGFRFKGGIVPSNCDACILKPHDGTYIKIKKPVSGTKKIKI